MVRRLLLVTGCVLSFASACGTAVRKDVQDSGQINSRKDGDAMEKSGEMWKISSEVIENAVKAVAEKHPTGSLKRIRTGVEQVAEQWTVEDGDEGEFQKFCVDNYIADSRQLETVFRRIQDNLEQVSGHFLEVSRFLKQPIHLESGPILDVDHMFAALDINAHFAEDLYKSKIAFLVLLNFKIHSLQEKIELGKNWTRKDWAYARLADLFVSRVPPWVKQQITQAEVEADTYITQYNIHMHHLLTADKQRLFPEGLKLISHWGLRDELKAQYALENGLTRQRMIQSVMEQIIEQKIPQTVIDNPSVDWVVETGEVLRTTAEKGNEAESESAPVEDINQEREPDTRYAMLQEIFKSHKVADAYYPLAPTYILRKFEWEREIPEDEVVSLLKTVLGAPVLKEIAELIEKRLGRPLEPFDIWYDGFKSRGTQSESDLDRIVAEKYPDAEAFQKDLPNILKGLGFDAQMAVFLSSKITVDNARGSGHAWGAERREDNAHLRTRIAESGMNYKGYNIAIHELGHNVEQVLTLNKIDHYILNGVPNTAFTEGFAFAFQSKDLQLLGKEEPDPILQHLQTLDTIWSTFEISGVALVDIGIWKWMYENPNATPAEIREAIVKIAKDVWNEFFAPVLGHQDQILLAIYSHIIDAGMYVPDYPMGFLIQFQMDEYFRKNGLAKEMVRMCRAGSVTPEAWMQAAVGSPISAEPILRAAMTAVDVIENVGKK